MSVALLLILVLSICRGASAFDNWAGLQGANYVPSYSRHDVHDIFTSRSWNATIVDRELGFAKNLRVKSLRVFVTQGAYKGDTQPEIFLKNYRHFQQLMLAHELKLMVTFAGLDSTCANATKFISTIVGAEVPGAVIAYEADNEPAPWAIDYVTNCTLPALLKASRNPTVDIAVGYVRRYQYSTRKPAFACFTRAFILIGLPMWVRWSRQPI